MLFLIFFFSKLKISEWGRLTSPIQFIIFNVAGLLLLLLLLHRFEYIATELGIARYKDSKYGEIK